MPRNGNSHFASVPAAPFDFGYPFVTLQGPDNDDLLAEKDSVLPPNVASANATFGDLIALLEPLGFRLDRVSGRHQIYRHPAVPRPIALQPECGRARPYQVSQLLELLAEFDLPGTGDHAREEPS